MDTEEILLAEATVAALLKAAQIAPVVGAASIETVQEVNLVEIVANDVTHLALSEMVAIDHVVLKIGKIVVDTEEIRTGTKRAKGEGLEAYLPLVIQGRPTPPPLVNQLVNMAH